MPESVFLLRAPLPPGSPDETARRLLEALSFRPAPGSRVLLKPNLVAPRNARLSCTSPAVVRAVCAALLDLGLTITLADSPAFGSAAQVARAAGLDEAVRSLGLKVRSLRRPAPLRLSFGGSIGLSRDALEQDAILNLPRLKAHAQMRVTASVKNLFGCVTGCRKALAHARIGDTGDLFARLIAEVMLALPPVATILDAVVPMHRTGPIKGDPFPLGLLAASADPVALDTAVYGLLGLSPERVPLWAECRRRGLPGADPAHIVFPLEQPDAFDASGFLLPDPLEPIEFKPLRLIRGRLKSLLGR
ncbi:MAG: DUF362 domain-containing protein [Desulfovibrio aminophilus]|jgi:uncharacterized protein (DUF362 family)|uniref:DUF362 domain-containing protein n=1 Tax=Desulfovibrio aminophilus TaxID=81425 RepID=UPI000405956C|nr:DUF362 domain-containing protein [Desulfovibrio aminophilus]MDY0305001.1 DUF362 domain-containing protein [Desulfovibrionaceae bacterium]